ncbi:MAG: hypothetical protein HKN70_00005, partial [Gammaproteobacteria bacterium]|nr:hypothetical protein [Gammaproteobacteria bacterium]
ELTELMSELDELVYDVDDSLADAAAAAGVEIQQSDWITRSGGTGIGSSAAVRDIAFSTEVLNDGLNSNAIEVDEKVVYVRLNEHRPAQLMTLDEVRPRIVNELKTRLAGEKATEIGTEQLTLLNNGNGIEEVALALDLEVSEERSIQRSDRELPAEAVTEIFAADKPGDTPVHGGASASNGDYVLFELNSVAAGDPLDDAQVEELVRAVANMEFAAYIAALREKAKVVTRPELLSQ